MDKEVIFKKRFLNKYLKLLAYLEEEFGTKGINGFNSQLARKISIIKIFPESGAPTAWEDVRTIQLNNKNRIFYRIKGNKISILNMFDVRMNPTKRPYNK